MIRTVAQNDWLGKAEGGKKMLGRLECRNFLHLNLGRWVWVALCTAMSAEASAQVTIESEYMRRLQISQSIAPMGGGSPFGESLNPYTGDLTFRQADIVLEGTGPEIRLVRSLWSWFDFDVSQLPTAFGNWTLSIPRIETLTDYPDGISAITYPGLRWKLGGSGDDRYKRCTRFNRPRYAGTLDDPEAGWNGMTLVVEDGSQQTILKRSAQNTAMPSMTDASGAAIVFPAVTSEGWQIGCLPATSNGETGEAFLVVSPSGTKYWMDHLVGERADTIYQQNTGATLRQFRMLARMYVSRVEDRFGNSVDYQYSAGKLTAITASDGRSVGIVWRSDVPVIDSISINPGTAAQRTWQYQYTSISSTPPVTAILTGVTLPDGSKWSLGSAFSGGRPFTHYLFKLCSTRSFGQLSYPTDLSGYISTMIAPSGMVGKFTIVPQWHARSYVASACLPEPAGGGTYEAIPSIFGAYSLVKKEISGPGLPARTWTYSYPEAVGSAARDACASTNSCPATKDVTATDPDGNVTRYTYSNRWGETEGKLLRTDIYQGSGTLLRSEVVAYASAAGGPYPSSLGSAMMGVLSNQAPQETLTPRKQVTVTQQGRAFTWQVASDCSGIPYCFDTYARPTKVTKSSAPAP